MVSSDAEIDPSATTDGNETAPDLDTSINNNKDIQDSSVEEDQNPTDPPSGNEKSEEELREESEENFELPSIPSISSTPEVSDVSEEELWINSPELVSDSFEYDADDEGT